MTAIGIMASGRYLSPATPPSIVGTSLLQTSGSGNRSISPHASTATGDLMIVINACDSGAASGMSPPGSPAWTTLLANTSTGTLRTSIYAKERAGGETSYSYTISGNAFSSSLCVTITGWDGTLGNIIVGTAGTRAGSGGTTTTQAPSITTTTDNNLVLCIGTERTTATESGISSINNSFTEHLWVGQSGGVETIELAKRTMTSAGVVGATTITYPNTQASNAAAVLIAIRPT